MKMYVRFGAAFALLCLVSGLAPSAPLAENHPPGTDETPVLGQVSYELKSKMNGSVQTEYVSPLGVRTDYEAGGSIGIWDFKTGQSHFLNAHTHKDMIRVGKPVNGGPRYYDSARWLKKLGTCSFIGEQGTLWQRPAFGYADEEEACITSDGIILAITDAGRPTKIPLELKRHDIPASMYEIPAGYARSVR